VIQTPAPIAQRVTLKLEEEDDDFPIVDGWF
jgi:hypothetical protein